MNSDKLFDMIGHANERYVSDAKTQKKRLKPWLIPAVAACLVCILTAGILFSSLFQPKPYGLLFEAQYPTAVKYPKYPTNNDQQIKAWRQNQQALNAAYEQLNNTPDAFFSSVIREFLTERENENPTISPLNVYMALAMLAETAGGDSREQILTLLGADSIEQLQKTVYALYRANYNNDGAQTNILANSLWMSDTLCYHTDVLQILAEQYFASSFSGEMGSKSYNDSLQTWLNDNTGGLLKDNIKDVKLSPAAVLALASTVYFNAKWDTTFEKEDNDEKIFHGTAGDCMTEFMNQTTEGIYYWSDNFSAVGCKFDLGGQMYFILPDEGVNTDEVLMREEAIKFMVGDTSSVNRTGTKINLSVPKFDLTSQTDLITGLKHLGVNDIFSAEKANFSPLTDASGVFVSGAEHAVRVKIDENGCTAAAYTTFFLSSAPMPPPDEVDFVLDRPFIFVITNDVGLPLFVGIVNII